MPSDDSEDEVVLPLETDHSAPAPDRLDGRVHVRRTARSEWVELALSARGTTEFGVTVDLRPDEARGLAARLRLKPTDELVVRLGSDHAAELADDLALAAAVAGGPAADTERS